MKKNEQKQSNKIDVIHEGARERPKNNPSIQFIIGSTNGIFLALIYLIKRKGKKNQRRIEEDNRRSSHTKLRFRKYLQYLFL